MDKKKYLDKIKKYTNAINESIKLNDFDSCDKIKTLLENVIDEYKTEYELLSESKTDNFGVLNDIIFENIPYLFKNNKSAVKKIMKTIKEDKNLSAQFNFYKVLGDYNSNISEKVTPKEYVTKVVNIAKKNISPKTLIESNRKLSKILVENDIKPLCKIDNDKREYFKSCQKLISKKNTFGNVLGIMESKKIVEKYIDENKKEKEKNDNVNIYEMINKYNDSKTFLNEEENELVQQITAARSPIAEERKKKLFEKFKNECISKIDSLIKESNEEDKQNLSNLKEQLNSYKFNTDTLVTDIAKLLEIRDVLLDK